MKYLRLLSLLLLVSQFLACTSEKDSSTFILVKNELDLDRKHETVELSRSDLGLEEGVLLAHVFIKDPLSSTYEITQTIDKNNDGVADILLFQPLLRPLEEKSYQITIDAQKSQDTTERCFSRFVPERTDDYAWENDRVAFRTFGPTAQKMIEENVKGHTYQWHGCLAEKSGLSHH